MPHLVWHRAAPLLALAYFGLLVVSGRGSTFNPTALGVVIAAVLLPILVWAVFASVHHAEELAHRLGEPYGTLMLTLAVTVIEVSLIASLMLTQKSNPALARDTIFSVIMIVCNGLVGLCILLGGLRYREQDFRVTGASAYLCVLLALGTLTLILPNFTRTTPGPMFSIGQLAFVSVMTILLYGVFLYIQTVRHQDYFTATAKDAGSAHADQPLRAIAIDGFWLLASVLAVVLLAKKFAAVIEAGLDALGAPAAVAGAAVAALLLAPECMAAIRAARQDELQRSINLALGSSLATIGLTMPAVAIVSAVLGTPLVIGLEGKDIVLLTLTFGISIITFGTGRTNILFGFVHAVVFATFAFLLFQP